MEIIFQDLEGEINELNGRICEILLCVQVANEESISPGVFWLKILNENWHRFFLDTEYNFLVWTINNEIDNSDLEDKDFPVIDIGERYKLKDRPINEIIMKQIQEDEEQVGCLTILFSEGYFLELKQGSKISSLQISNLLYSLARGTGGQHKAPCVSAGKETNKTRKPVKRATAFNNYGMSLSSSALKLNLALMHEALFYRLFHRLKLNSSFEI